MNRLHKSEKSRQRGFDKKNLVSMLGYFASAFQGKRSQNQLASNPICEPVERKDITELDIDHCGPFAKTGPVNRVGEIVILEPLPDEVLARHRAKVDAIHEAQVSGAQMVGAHARTF